MQLITRENTWLALVSFTLCSFAFSERINSWGIMLLLVFFLADKNLIQKIKQPIHFQKAFPLFGFFLVYLVFFLLSEKHAGASHSLMSKLSLLLLPMLFSYESYFTAKNEKLILFLFSIALTIGFFLGLCSSLYCNYFIAETPNLTLALNRMKVSSAIMHPGYYSNYFMLGILWHYFNWNKWSLFFSVLFTIVLALLVSRIVLLFYIIFITYLGFRHIRKTTKPLLYGFLAMLMAALFSIAAYQIPTIHARVNDTFLGFSNASKTTDIKSATASRVIAYKNEMQLIKKKPIFGYGLGNAVSVLQKQLHTNGYEKLAEKMHIHNQFFHTWLQTGIVGVLMLLTLLGLIIKYFKNKKLWVPFWFTILVCMNLMTDDMLEIQAGIVFFALTWSLYLFRKQVPTNQ